MANEVSRRQFLKGGLAAAAGVSLFGLGFTPKAAAEGKYTPGTYSAVVKGKVSDVTVTMTFNADSITDVKVDVSGETQGIGSVIGEKMEEALLSGQTWDVDAVSGATESSDAVRKAAAACVAQATGSEVVIEDNIPTANSDWLGEEPAIADSDIKAEYECDVLVIGAGTSGSFAACAAVEEGTKTILIERFNHDMASGIRDTLAACGSKQQIADGDDVDKETPFAISATGVRVIPAAVSPSSGLTTPARPLTGSPTVWQRAACASFTRLTTTSCPPTMNSWMSAIPLSIPMSDTTSR